MFPRERCVLKVENILPWWSHPNTKEKYSVFLLFLRVSINWIKDTGNPAALFWDSFIHGLKWRISEAFWSFGCSHSHKGSHAWQPEPLHFQKSAEWNNWCSTAFCAHSSCWLFFFAVHFTLGKKKGCILKGSCPSGEPWKLLCSKLEEMIEFLHKTCNYPKNFWGGVVSCECTQHYI